MFSKYEYYVFVNLYSFIPAGITVRKPVLHNILVGDGDGYVLNLLPGEEAKLTGFMADPKSRRLD